MERHGYIVYMVGVPAKGGKKPFLVGRCRLTVSKAVFNTPMVSALETFSA